MTGLQSRAGPAGLAQWMLEEQRFAAGIVAEDVEEFSFSVRNEMEWLNEHMADVFSRAQFDVAEVFKTPGKLRGKTPRTLRKRVAVDDRAPLTDIFAPQLQPVASPAQNTHFYKQITQIKIAEDSENHVPSNVQQQRYSFGPGKENNIGPRLETATEYSNGFAQPKSPTQQVPIFKNLQLSVKSNTDRGRSPTQNTTANRKESEDTFVSAKESPVHKLVDQTTSKAMQSPLAMIAPTAQQSSSIRPQGQDQTSMPTKNIQEQSLQDIVEDDEAVDPEKTEEYSPAHQSLELTVENTPSQDTSPARATIRKKSSLTFASLPAREPLTSKKSVGMRVSTASHFEGSRPAQVLGEGDELATGAQPIIQNRTSDNYVVEDTDMDALGERERAAMDAARNDLTTTQRLHERMAMLRQNHTQPPTRTANVNLDNVAEPSAVPQDHGDNDDDWIGPIVHSNGNSALPEEVIASEHALEGASLRRSVNSKPVEDETMVPRPQVDIFAIPSSPEKSVMRKPIAQSAFEKQSEGNHAKPMLAAYPSLTSLAISSNTPKGSPNGKKFGDGPLSASKAKLMSVFKSAKGIFASSAGVSTQAKLEALSSHSLRSRNESQLTLASSISTTSSRTDTVANSLYPTISHAIEENPGNVARLESPRRSVHSENKRRSSARIENMKSTKTLGEATSDVTNNIDTVSQNEDEDQTEVPIPQPLKTRISGLHISKNEARRPLRPAKEGALKAKPAPVSIRVASQRIGQTMPSNTTVAAAPAEGSTAPAPARRPNMVKKGSNSSLQTTSSAQTLKSSSTTQATRPKALDAAARKKEQDEREAQRKVEQKRELERKRAAKIEEDKRIAQEQRIAEQQRLAEAKATAIRQAADQRRAEEARLDQQRLQAAARVQAIPHINAAKPAKRQYQEAHEDERAQQAQDQMSMPPPKRRRTSEIEQADTIVRPTAAPPIRLSSMRKEVASKFTHNPNSAAHAGPSMLKSAINAQHALQHPKTPHMNELAKYSNAKIPFADASNPPGATSQSLHHQRSQPLAKTPASVVYKSSPQYPNGDNIELPEIATDSEDSEDENDFVPPDWANSPALRDLLRQQQLVDPLKVFGPIAPLMMEEVFKGNKERQARFRARTSSANWNGPDRLTEDERRRDFEARERLEQNGGWTFGTGA